jgi:hypothetical protein
MSAGIDKSIFRSKLMLKKAIFIAAAAMALSAPAFAHDASKTADLDKIDTATTCYYNDGAFSEGAIVDVGRRTIVCSPEAAATAGKPAKLTWQPLAPATPAPMQMQTPNMRQPR